MYMYNIRKTHPSGKQSTSYIGSYYYVNNYIVLHVLQVTMLHQVLKMILFDLPSFSY